MKREKETNQLERTINNMIESIEREIEREEWKNGKIEG